MKGPSGRARFDLRRHWLCPQCQAKRWTGGHVVNLRCPRCAAHQPPRETWMHLLEEPRLARSAKPEQTQLPSTSPNPMPTEEETNS